MINLNSNETMLLLAVLVSAIATFLTRALPFYAMNNFKPSNWLNATQKHMGIMIMVILVFYVLKDTKFNVYPYGLSELTAVLSTIFIHKIFKNILLSIVFSTAIYMLCIRAF